MTNQKENPTRCGQVGATSAAAYGTESINLDTHMAEEALLRALMGLPANVVVAVLSKLEPMDFCYLPHADIADELRGVAQGHMSNGNDSAPVDPSVVQQRMLNAGTLNDRNTAQALVAVTAGAWEPVAIKDVRVLADSLRTGRLRRAMRTFGDSLNETAETGSLDDVRRVLGNIEHLEHAAERAGVADLRNQFAARRAASLRCEPLATGHRDPLAAATDAPSAGWGE